jgi:single-stranded DNA-binding protein
MRHLNSILLEGYLADNPVDMVTLPLVTFRLEHRYDMPKSDEGLIENIETFTVHVIAPRLREVCMEYLKAGRGVRIVGRLSSNNTGTFIIAEHIEFKPVMPKEASK